MNSNHCTRIKKKEYDEPYDGSSAKTEHSVIMKIYWQGYLVNKVVLSTNLYFVNVSNEM